MTLLEREEGDILLNQLKRPIVIYYKLKLIYIAKPTDGILYVFCHLEALNRTLLSILY